MKQDAKKIIRPNITAKHRYEGNGFYIQVELAGANKDTIELQVGTYGLSVKAEGDNIRYDGNFPLGYNIIPEKAKANYEDEVLYVSLPIKEKSLNGTKIDIVTT